MQGILDESGIRIPTMQVPEEELKREKRMAVFYESDEYKLLEEHIDTRIAFYQNYLPDGRALTGVDTKELSNMWLAANAIIGELRLIKQSYQDAKEAIDASRSRQEAI